jgi:SAM-dependent methyltransferase
MSRNNILCLEDGFQKLGSTGVDRRIPKIIENRKKYADAVAMFGGRKHLPSTVMRVKRHRTQADRDGAGHDHGFVAVANRSSKEQGVTSKAIHQIIKVGAKDKGKSALSTFPQAMCATLTKFYTHGIKKPRVGDPFAGHNSRMEAVSGTGAIYYGQDLCAKFMAHNRKRAEVLRAKGAKIHLYEGDSRELQMKSNSMDFIITSPPYWNIEKYGPEKGQLGELDGGYKAFLKGLSGVMEECYRVLKPGAVMLWVVNDFRKKKKFVPFHVDVMELAEMHCFEMHDLMIVDHGRSTRDAYLNAAMEQRVLPKRHEIGLVFHKPNEQSKKN